MRVWLLKKAPFFALFVFLSPLGVWLMALSKNAEAGSHSALNRNKLYELTHDSTERQVFVWYMTGCRPCVQEYPMLSKVDSLAKGTGAFSITVIGLGHDSSLREDKFWRRISLRKVCSLPERGSAYASPSYYLSGKLESPSIYPTLIILDKGKMEKYHYGAVNDWQKMVPEGVIK